MERISIGFQAGQTLGVRVDEEQVKSLTQALGQAQGWHQLETDEGPINLKLDAIVYLRTENTESKVGFGL